MNYDYFLIMKFLISGISILALTQIIFDVLEAKHKSGKRRKMFQRILWQGSPIVLGMATLSLFSLKEKDFGWEILRNWEQLESVSSS